MLTGFANSSWPGLWILLSPPASSTSASPTRTSFGWRWTSPRRQPGKSSISKTLRCSSRLRRAWGFKAFFTRITGPPARGSLRSDCGMKKESSIKPANPRILTINGGSSSIKFALFEAGDSLRWILEGSVERIGLPEATLRVKGLNQADNFSRTLTAPDHTAAVGALMDWNRGTTRASHADRGGPPRGAWRTEVQRPAVNHQGNGRGVASAHALRSRTFARGDTVDRGVSSSLS